MVMAWDGIIYFCTTNNTEGQTYTISKTHGQKATLLLSHSKCVVINDQNGTEEEKMLVESEVSRDNHRK